MRNAVAVLAGIVMLIGAAMPALGDGAPVWPAGRNPKTNEPINGFCDAFQAVQDNGLLSMLAPQITAFFMYLNPMTADVNGASYVITSPLSYSFNGDGMLDCSIELKLVEEALRDTAFSVNGLTHAAVHAAWDANEAQFAFDMGTYWGLYKSLAPGLGEVLKGYMILGDGDAVFSDGASPDSKRVDATGSAGLVKAVMFLFSALGIHNPYIDLAQYSRMPKYFAKWGDADGDRCRNYQEFLAYGSDPALYVVNALNPNVNPGHCHDFHSADYNPQDHQIKLPELLRLVQFYNSTEYHVQAGTADGYAPAAGSHDGPPHDSDYSPQDWKIGLAELLRLVQFYNSAGYHIQAGTVDGFAPGL